MEEHTVLRALTIEHGEDERLRKKSRFLPQWESSLYKKDAMSSKSLSLKSLFGVQLSDSGTARGRPVTSRGNGNDQFFTFRLEHREGGVMARHAGEERILLFRSDRPGAIAKIIYSSTPPKPCKMSQLSSMSSRSYQQQHFSMDEKVSEQEQEEMLIQLAQAKVHVLEVKEGYRGYDFGGLLFSEAMNSLKNRYMRRYDSDEDDGSEDNSNAAVCCDLDAEEDTRRHNALVGFYERLGCYVKPKAKCRYINNNDGETYRKVPMQIALQNQRKNIVKKKKQRKEKGQITMNHGSLVGRGGGGFLPVKLFQATGKPLDIDWLIIDDGEGFVEFHTTKGQYLHVDRTGRCITVNPDDEEDEEDDDMGMPKEESQTEDSAATSHRGKKLILLRVSDTKQNVLSGGEDDDDEAAAPNAEPTNHESTSIGSNQEGRVKELWLIKSCNQGVKTFLTLDQLTCSLTCSKTPSFWQADSSNRYSLTWTTDTPCRRQHYRKLWSTQTVDFVRSMRSKYLNFNLAKMTIKQALDLISNRTAFPFLVEGDMGRQISLRSLCFRTAEEARAAGHPDWVQLIALIHALGSVVNCIDIANEIATEDQEYDWTIASRSHIVGCASPNNTVFAEFRHLNSDENDPDYNSPLGIYNSQCGLDNVLLTWTGTEYMYHMLKHNSVGIPGEGLAILRYYSLSDWHTRDAYLYITNEDDCDIQPFVADFDELRLKCRQELLQEQQSNDFGGIAVNAEMTSKECDKLWNMHYSDIASKYLADELLMW